MNSYKVELYDSKSNEFFFIEIEAKDSHQAICKSENEWDNSYAVEATLIEAS